MPTIKEMKAQLKELAVKIRESKTTYKGQQRVLSAFEQANPSWRDDWRTAIYKERCGLVPDYPSFYGDAQAFRYMHVVYCMARGRKYEQVEPKVREGNEIDMPRVEKMLAGVVYESKTDNRCAG